VEQAGLQQSEANVNALAQQPGGAVQQLAAGQHQFGGGLRQLAQEAGGTVQQMAAGQWQLAQQSGVAIARAAVERLHSNSGLQHLGGAQGSAAAGGRHGHHRAGDAQAWRSDRTPFVVNEAQLAAMQQQGSGSGVVGENAVARAYVAAPIVQQQLPHIRDGVAPTLSNAEIAENANALVRARGGQTFKSPPRMRLADGALHAAVMNATPATRPNPTSGDLGSAIVPAIGRAIVPLADPMIPGSDDDSL
jgi:hypothetical protein